LGDVGFALDLAAASCVEFLLGYYFCGMDLLLGLFVAVGLATEVFAVSVVSGVLVPAIRLRHALLIGAVFALFQMVLIRDSFAPPDVRAFDILMLQFLTNPNSWAAKCSGRVKLVDVVMSGDRIRVGKGSYSLRDFKSRLRGDSGRPLPSEAGYVSVKNGL
jgi:hypothetical protein